MSLSFQNPIICAIDTKDTATALQLCNNIKPHVGLIKIGLEFFTINGPAGIEAIKSCNIPIFLDLKFHDIPNTVAHAVRSATQLGIQMLTIHTSGGKTMMQAASTAAKEEAASLGITPPLILGVTVLTSMDAGDLKEINVEQAVERQVVSLAKLAQNSGLDGVICSPFEIAAIKKECGANFKLIVPGIRPANSVSDDQKRTMSAHDAVKNGADFIVVGRPITKAANPEQAAKEIFLEVKSSI